MNQSERSLAAGIAAPFAPGSVSLGLHLHDAQAADAADLLIDEARAAESAGFDGVSISEHHGGFRGYFPSPVLAASWMLTATERLWVAPCPILLPLRSARLVSEEVGWLCVRHPHRLALGLAPGYLESDFEIADSSFGDRASRYASGVEVLTAALRGEDSLLASDRALAEGYAASVPIVSAAGSVTAAVRAAQLGVGLIFGAYTSRERLEKMLTAFADEGGAGPIVFIRRVWVGHDAPVAAVREQLEAYSAGGTRNAWMDDGVSSYASGSPEHIASELDDVRSLAASASLNVRIHAPGVEPAAVRDQIASFGSEVLPIIRGMR